MEERPRDVNQCNLSIRLVFNKEIDTVLLAVDHVCTVYIEEPHMVNNGK
jgi:hypothetical protein